MYNLHTGHGRLANYYTLVCLVDSYTYTGGIVMYNWYNDPILHYRQLCSYTYTGGIVVYNWYNDPILHTYALYINLDILSTV